MARIRCIKPETPQSPSLGRVSRDARLLFIQLWTVCDDAGRCRGDGRLLASLLYPYDDDAKGLIDGWLTELVSVKAIRRYVVDGEDYVDIPKWLSHQKIEKPSLSKLPACPSDSGNVLDSSPNVPESSAAEGKGRERKGVDREVEGRGVALALVAPAPPTLHSPADLRDAWNTVTSAPIAQCLELGDGRKRKAQVRLRERPFADWVTVIGRIEGSSFCRGENDRAWVASFDWLLQADTAAKVLEGKYDNRQRLTSASGSRTGDSRDAAVTFLHRRAAELQREEAVCVSPLPALTVKPA